MVNHCIKVRHREIFARERYNFCFFPQNMTNEKKKLCRHGVMMRFALNESDIDTF